MERRMPEEIIVAFIIREMRRIEPAVGRSALVGCKELCKALCDVMSREEIARHLWYGARMGKLTLHYHDAPMIAKAQGALLLGTNRNGREEWVIAATLPQTGRNVPK